MSKNYSPHMALLACALAGCNSGSRSAAPAPETTVAADVELNVDNAMDASKAAIRGAFDMQRLAYIGTSFLRTLQPLPPEPESVGTLPATQPIEVFGAQGGSALFNWEDVDADARYSSGDVFSIGFETYGEDGLALDGTIIIDDFVVSGGLPSNGVWILNATLNLINLTTTVGTQETTFNLELPVYLENRFIVEIFETTLPEDVVFGTLELKAGNRMTRFANPESIGLQFEGAVFSPDLDGTIRYATPGTLGGNPFFPDPSSGLMIVEGANESRLELEMGFFTLAIHVDADGDEEIEETIQTSFFALAP